MSTYNSNITFTMIAITGPFKLNTLSGENFYDN